MTGRSPVESKRTEGGRWLLSVFFSIVLAACGERPQPPAPASDARETPADPAGAFLERHWERPLAPQGPAPDRFSAQERSLAPADCGACHAAQHADWLTSLHAHAMGPGLLGQLADMDPGDRDAQQDCIRCHAPLAEQADSLAAALSAPGESRPGRAATSRLHEEGLICAACHVRAHERFGPPRRDGSAPEAAARAALPHNGFVASAAFEDSRFCAACHQFEPDGFALAGKLLENTYEEWKASRHAREARSCQSCHMPERRHLWRGIHDPQTTRGALSIEAPAPRLSGGGVVARLRIRNTGAGHHFPTYVTPRVVASIWQEDAAGKPLPGTRAELVIQRRVPLDLSREISDTRIPAGGEAALEYALPPHPRAVALRLRLLVEPDAFYADLYRSLLASGGGPGRGRASIRKALAAAEGSAYVAWEERQPLPEP
ncbi:MAG: hypothetical protein Fur0039_05910 [Rhodocyclaceae bacterium]